MAYPKPYLLLCLFIFSVLVLRSQDCSNLGPGLFPDGDFGAGIELVATDTPYLAPFWYTYTPAPPLPGDAYSITNNTAPWAAASGEGWLSTTDNSPDPEGYMMVVNSTQNATVFWVRSIHLCGDAYYRVAFDAINLQHPDSALAPQPILQLYVNSELQANFGALPQDGQWHTFEQDIYLAAPAGGNVLFELFNSNPGLAGNDFAIDNLSLQRCGPSAEVFSTSGGPACPGDAASFGIDIGPGFSPPYIQWQSSTDGGATWQDSGSPGTATSHTIPVLLPGAWVRALVAGTLAELDNENCPLPSTIFQPQFLDINSCFELPVSLNGG
ncbi:MAG: hypothetical protein KDD19_01670, partial [Phaeodactylibacter sp.]|nr:hypothetical protein [Phaeodactylibacter sp.]